MFPRSCGSFISVVHLVPCVLPSPERLVAGPSAHGLAAVVRGEDDDRLVQHALVGEGGLDLADGVVHGRDHGGGRLALLPAEHAAVGADVFLLEETTEVRCLSTTVSYFSLSLHQGPPAARGCSAVRRTGRAWSRRDRARR